MKISHRLCCHSLYSQTHTYTHSHADTCIPSYIKHAYTRTRTLTLIHRCAYTYTLACISTYNHTYTHTQTHSYTHTDTLTCYCPLERTWNWLFAYLPKSLPSCWLDKIETVVCNFFNYEMNKFILSPPLLWLSRDSIMCLTTASDSTLSVLGYLTVAFISSCFRFMYAFA